MQVLLAAGGWDPASLPPLYSLLQRWPRPDTIDILQLLLPIFPDTTVRARAVTWLDSLHSDQLADFLPQLVEAVKHETWSASPLARLLVRRSLLSPSLCHQLYWLLTQALPGLSPQVRISVVLLLTYRTYRSELTANSDRSISMDCPPNRFELSENRD